MPVVADDAALAAQLRAALAEAGDTIELARDGTTGEFPGATEAVSAAVPDLGMPGTDGIEGLRR